MLKLQTVLFYMYRSVQLFFGLLTVVLMSMYYSHLISVSDTIATISSLDVHLTDQARNDGTLYHLFSNIEHILALQTVRLAVITGFISLIGLLIPRVAKYHKQIVLEGIIFAASCSIVTLLGNSIIRYVITQVT